MRPLGDAKFIAFEALEEVEGASVEWRGGSLVVFCEVRLAGVDEELGAGGHADQAGQHGGGGVAADGATVRASYAARAEANMARRTSA